MTAAKKYEMIVIIIQQIFEIKKKEYADQLMQRRRRLAELFNSEMNGWKLEVMARVETVVDRKKRYRVYCSGSSLSMSYCDIW